MGGGGGVNKCQALVQGAKNTRGLVCAPGCVVFLICYACYAMKFAFTYPDTPVFGTNTHT